LNQTWPTGDAQLLPMMDYDIRHGRTYMYLKDKPLYAFGFGLSYTSFAYEGLRLSSPSTKADGQITATVKVKNNGFRAGDEVVQLYVQHLGSVVERPRIELEGFERVHLNPGAQMDVHFKLRPRDLAYWDTAEKAWHVEKELVRILAGGSSDKLPIDATLEIQSDQEFLP